MTIERPMFPPCAESVHNAFSPQPGIGQPGSQTLTSESAKGVGGVSRRHMLAGLAILPTSVVGIPISAAAATADAELIALGKQLEPLVDAYYLARQPWARALTERNSELQERFGRPADCGYQYPPEYETAADQIDQRSGLDEASDKLHVAFERVETIARAIERMPCRSVEGLRAKALVAFWEVAPLSAGSTEFHFEDAYPFQQLFSAVAELCGLDGKLAETGFDLPDIYVGDDQDDEEEA
jgi:hypothetical protein